MRGLAATRRPRLRLGVLFLSAVLLAGGVRAQEGEVARAALFHRGPLPADIAALVAERDLDVVDLGTAEGRARRAVLVPTSAPLPPEEGPYVELFLGGEHHMGAEAVVARLPEVPAAYRTEIVGIVPADQTVYVQPSRATDGRFTNEMVLKPYTPEGSSGPTIRAPDYAVPKDAPGSMWRRLHRLLTDPVVAFPLAAGLLALGVWALRRALREAV